MFICCIRKRRAKKVMSCSKLILRRHTIWLIGIFLSSLLWILVSLLKSLLSLWTTPLQQFCPWNGIVRSWNLLPLKRGCVKVSWCLFIFLLCVWRNYHFLHNKRLISKLGYLSKLIVMGQLYLICFLRKITYFSLRSNPSQIKLVKEVLDNFCKTSRLKVNL